MSATESTVKSETFDGPLAFLADVHGNLEALEAVVGACREAGVSAYFVAGDLLLQGDDPLGTWLKLMEIGARCTRGTSDIALAAVDPDKLRPNSPEQQAAADRFRQTRTQLGELILARLRRLPDILRIELKDGSEIAVVHGSPVDPTEPITHDLEDEEISALIGDDPADVLVCGGGHVAFQRDIGGVQVLGVGSVGDETVGRVAHYLLIEPTDEGLAIDARWVGY